MNDKSCSEDIYVHPVPLKIFAEMSTLSTTGPNSLFDFSLIKD